MLTNLTPARQLGSALAYYASPAPDEAAHRRQGRGRNDRAPREEQGPAVLHRRRLLPAALSVHRAARSISICIRSIAFRRQLRSPARCSRPPRGSRLRRTGASANEGQRESIRAYYASITFLDANVGRAARRARSPEADRQHHRRLPQRPWLPPRRARAVDEADVVRALGARAADRLPVPALPRKGAPPRGSSSSSTSIRRSRIWRGLPPPPGLHGRSLAPLLENPQAEWDHPALTQVRRGAAERDVHGLQRPH